MGVKTAVDSTHEKLSKGMAKLDPARHATRNAISKVLAALNFEWLNLRRWPAMALLVTILVALSLTVGLTAKPVKDGVTLGVEFGGGYNLHYQCYQKQGGPPVTEDTVTAQAKSMYSSCVSLGHSNCVVQFYKPSAINVVIPGVSTQAEIQPVLDSFASEPLGLTLKFSLSLSGVLGSSDLHDTVKAAGIAFGVVWGVLLLRYLAAGVMGLFCCVVFLWLLLLFFNASPSVLSEAAIVAFVINIGLAADAHILTFERVREKLHRLPAGAPRADGLAAMLSGTNSSMVTILESMCTTVICMLVLYFVGEGPVSDFSFTVLLSVACSLLVNVLLARLLLKLGWDAGVISTGAFFGDKGPSYDAEESKKWWTTNFYWRPRRRVKFNFISWWWVGAAATFSIVVAGSVFLAHQDALPLNLDIDFTAGTALDLQLQPGSYTCDDLTSTAEDTGPSVATCALGGDGKHAALRFDDVLSTDDVQAIVTAMEAAYGAPVTFSENTVDPSVAIQMVHHGITAICIAAGVAALFVWLRFDLATALATFYAMASAGIFALCCFAIGNYEIDVTYVAATLTIFAFTVNDCVVVADFIRSERSQRRPATPPQLKAVVNEALGRVLIRSLLTLAMLVVCSLCLVYMGAEPLRAFSLAITFGIVSAAYTTILLVAPLYYALWATAWGLRAWWRGEPREGVDFHLPPADNDGSLPAAHGAGAGAGVSPKTEEEAAGERGQPEAANGQLVLAPLNAV